MMEDKSFNLWYTPAHRPHITSLTRKYIESKLQKRGSEEMVVFDSRIRDTLLTTTQSSGKTGESGTKRFHNIRWIQDLSREGLYYRRRVKQILIATTKAGEELYIQYPGKESIRDDDKQRPWDFFPRLRIANSYGSDLNFKAIWDALFEGLESKKYELKSELQALATIFYRMAYMVDHARSEEPVSLKVRYVEYEDDHEIVTEEDVERFDELYLYSPSDIIIAAFSDLFPTCDMSFEAFLHYNNLLAWNEDCKYYHRAMVKGKPWMGATGRINNLLTHVSVLGYLIGELSISDVFYKFSTGAGVAPATGAEITKITGGLVTKSNPHPFQNQMF